MTFRSFRGRIALFSVLLSGSILAVFGIWSWKLLYSTGLERIDNQINELSRPHIVNRQTRGHWERLDESLQFVYGNLTTGSIILLATTPDKRILFRSHEWPEELDSVSLPKPDPWEDLPNADFRPDDPPPSPRREFGPGRQGPPPRRRGPGARRGGPSSPPTLPSAPAKFVTRATENGVWRLGIMSNPNVELIVGVDLGAFQTRMANLRMLYAVAGVVAMLCVGAAGFLFSQRALRPLTMLTLAAESVTARGLDQRLPTQKEDKEFARLIAVFNGMMERLDRSFQQASRFSADAAHELKTPLTVLQGQLESAVQDADQTESQRAFLGQLLEEVQRMKSITQKLLLLSTFDTGHVRIHRERVNVSQLLDETVEDIVIMAPRLRVKSEIKDNCYADADEDLLRQVFHNLAGNAIKYNKPGGAIWVSLLESDGVLACRVSNTGAPISPEDRERIFDRFYRVDKARGRNIEGAGLGLSLSREIVRIHGGDIRLLDQHDHRETILVRLPIAHDSEHA
jgi:heavy metal sensor kinase